MSVEGRVLPLTTIEYEILSRLTQAAGSVITREQLIVEVFEREFDPQDRALDVHIHHLRRKLGSHSELLVTVRGAGHMLRAPAFAPQPARYTTPADAAAAEAM